MYNSMGVIPELREKREEKKNMLERAFHAIAVESLSCMDAKRSS